MSVVLSVLSLLLLFFLPGYLALLIARGGEAEPGRLSIVEAIFVAIVSSVILTTGLSLAMGWTDTFSPLRLFLVVATLALPLILTVVVRRIPLLPWTTSSQSLVPFGLLAILALAYLPPSEFVFGRRDDGTYVNAAAQLANEGGLRFEDDLLARMSPDERRLHSPLYLPGFYFTDQEQRGSIVSHGFHFYPAFLAALHSVGGLSFALAGPCFLTLLSILAAYLLGSILAGHGVGVLVALLIGIHPMTVWFSGETFSEGMCEALVLSSAALLLLGWRETAEPRRFGGLPACLLALSGVALSAVHLTKIEFILLPAIVVVFAFCAWAYGHMNSARWLFPVGYLVGLLIALALASTTNRLYTLATLSVYGELNSTRAAASLALVPLVGGALFFFRDALRRTLRRVSHARVLWIACGVTLITVGLLYSMAPDRIPLRTLREPYLEIYEGKPEWLPQSLFRSGRNLQALGFYLSVPGLFLGLLGAFLLLGRPAALPLVPTLVLACVQTGFYAYATSVGQGHIDSHRRFLVPIPVLILSAVVPFFVRAVGERFGRIARVAGIAVAVYLGAHFLQASWPFLWNRPWCGSEATILSVAGEAPDNAIWLASRTDEDAARLLVPLQFIAGAKTFLVDDDIVDGERLPTLLTRLGAEGLTPVVLLGREPPAEWLRRCREVFEPFEPRVIEIVEPIVVGQVHRLPDTYDFRLWRYHVYLHEGTRAGE